MVRVWVESRRKELPPKLSHRVIIGDLREVVGHLWMWIHSFLPSYLHLFLHLFCCCFLFFLFFIFFFFFFFRFLVLSIHLQSRLSQSSVIWQFDETGLHYYFWLCCSSSPFTSFSVHPCFSCLVFSHTWFMSLFHIFC